MCIDGMDSTSRWPGWMENLGTCGVSWQAWVLLSTKHPEMNMCGTLKVYPNGQRAHAGNLQHFAIQQDSGMIGRRDGKSGHVLAERDAAERQLWEQIESPNHHDRTEVGLQ